MFIFGVSQIYVTEILQLYWSVNMFHKLLWRQWLLSVAHVVKNTWQLVKYMFCFCFCFVFLKLPFHLNRRPLMPVSKLTVSEPYENYMSRSYQVTKDILSDCKNTGERRSAQHLEAVLARLPCEGEPRCLSSADAASCLMIFSPLLPLHPQDTTCWL